MGRKDHLLYRNLHNVDISYLRALLSNDTAAIRAREENARSSGYGPLAPCRHTAEVRQVGDFCGTGAPMPIDRVYRCSTLCIL